MESIAYIAAGVGLAAACAGSRRQQRRLGRDLARQKAFVDIVVGSMADTLLAVSTLGAVEDVNAACLELLGYSRDQLLGMRVGQVVDTSFQDLVAIGNARGLDVVLQTRDGAGVPMVVNISAIRDPGGELVGLVLVGRDMRETQRLRAAAAAGELERTRAEELAAAHAELRETQAQLVQASKLAALGELGAGVAHELNQPLAAMRGFLQLLRRMVEARLPEALDTIDGILSDTDRMTRIVDNVRTFARQSDSTHARLAPLGPMDAALELLTQQLRLHEIEVERRVDAAFPDIAADPIQLQQVFLNLLANARDALDAVDGGRRLRVSVTSDHYRVLYRVEDNGPGVPSDLIARVFDPFFTTKPPGAGMGLGLSLSYGIVRDHGGDITYETSDAGGARFTVAIPIHVERHDELQMREVGV